ncbi:MAG: hypothetical protein KatS3mg109_0751 [Pirellulaceae bacterium]|nr:MAG: hypothetical protein KatS3mg109_0751 [Pirellulaceae bacterium]
MKLALEGQPDKRRNTANAAALALQDAAEFLKGRE